MLCQKCGKYQASTHIRTVVNGVVHEMDLCSRCAAESGYGPMAPVSLMDMLASMFGDSLQAGSALGDSRCGCCGATFSDIAQTGKVGCPECYKTFKNELLPYLKRVHGSTRHIGKRPDRPVPAVAKNDRLSELRRKLDDLIKREAFEEAAVIRDEIKKEEGKRS